jgi:hypothetical protein
MLAVHCGVDAKGCHLRARKQVFPRYKLKLRWDVVLASKGETPFLARICDCDKSKKMGMVEREGSENLAPALSRTKKNSFENSHFTPALEE